MMMSYLLELPTSEADLTTLREDDFLDVSQLFLEDSFNVQVLKILTHVRLTQNEVANLQCLLKDLTCTLRHVWPDVQVHPFGSIVTGLAIKTSDIDCYIHLPTGNPVQKPVNRARKLLQRYSSIFTHTIAINGAKVPIVKFIHRPTGFRCDINFSNLGGVRNSKLISFLLRLDPRALPIAIILKYWSKVYKFTGTNLLSNYALSLMVIFYLQVKFVLPSVAEIQQHTQCQWVGDWNTAFNESTRYFNNNTQTLYELLGGFFEYYKSFDYARYVISPYLGYAVEKQQLRDLNDLPSEYNVYVQNVWSNKCKLIRLETPLCIQDQFDHSRNCAVSVPGKLFNIILGHITIVDRIFHERPRNSFLKGMFTHKLMYEPVQSIEHGESGLNYRNGQPDRHEKPEPVYNTQYRSGMSEDELDASHVRYPYSRRHVIQPEWSIDARFISPKYNETVYYEQFGQFIFKCFFIIICLVIGLRLAAENQ